MEVGDGSSTFIEVFLSGIDVSKKLGEKFKIFPRDVSVLIGMVEEKLSCGPPFKIHFHPRNYRSNTFIGTIEVFENDAHIYYDRDRNRCWRRFIVVKEVCHLLYAGRGEEHLASTPDRVEQLITKIMAGLEKIDITKDHVTSTETCTMLMALEVLLPHGERSKVDAIMAASNSNPVEVAKAYLVPETMVRFYLDPNYASMMETGWQSITHKSTPFAAHTASGTIAAMSFAL